MNKPVSVVIFEDGSIEVTGPITIGQVQVAVRQLQAAINNVKIGPQAPPDVPTDGEEHNG